MAEVRVGVGRELTADQVADLRFVGIMPDDKIGPGMSYFRLKAEDEREAREKFAAAVGLDPRELSSVRLVG
jgi:hypothetical protein